MEVINKKNEIVKTMMNVEYYPALLKEEIALEKTTKVPCRFDNHRKKTG